MSLERGTRHGIGEEKVFQCSVRVVCCWLLMRSYIPFYGRVVCVYAGRQEPSAGLILHKNLKKGTLRVAAFAVVFDKVRLVELVRLSYSN